MIATQNDTPALDHVLAEIASSSTPPDAAQLRGWLAKYPEFKSEIIEFATDWVEMEAARVPHEVTREEVDLVVNRTMSRVHQILFDAKKPASLTDLMADVKASGHDLDSFQRAVGVDRSIVSCFAGRLIKPATVPFNLVKAMAEALNRPVEVLQDFLRLPPMPAGAYKARNRPQTKQEDFATILMDADLPEAEKARWLAEAPDPALQD
jgi:hypothetical protein